MIHLCLKYYPITFMWWYFQLSFIGSDDGKKKMILGNDCITFQSNEITQQQLHLE